MAGRGRAGPLTLISKTLLHEKCVEAGLSNSKQQRVVSCQVHHTHIESSPQRVVLGVLDESREQRSTSRPFAREAEQARAHSLASLRIV
jgi:hypothetical protein